MKAQLMLEVKMYCGLDLPTGGVVYEAEFREWLKDVVDVRFAGYNLAKTERRWHGESEDCYVLTFITFTIDDYRDVVYCAEQYKNEFSQDSVVVTRHTLEGAVFV